MRASIVASRIPAFALCILATAAVVSCGNAFGSLSKGTNVPVTGISLSSSQASCALNGNLTLSATLYPANATNATVVWQSDTVSIATVSDDTANTRNATVSGVAEGTATITARSADGGFTAQCVVTVRRVAVEGISVDESATVGIGGKKQLTAVFTPASVSNSGLVWTSGNEAVATVDSAGLVTGVAQGSATVTVTTSDGGFTASCAVTVQSTVSVTGVTLDPSYLSLIPGATKLLSAAVSPANATNPALTWSSSNTSVATVDSTGIVTAVVNGLATITAMTADGVGASCSITVDDFVVSPSSATIAIGKTCQLSAVLGSSVSAGTTVSWQSSNGTVASVDANGLVRGVAAGMTTIGATASYNGMLNQRYVQITVTESMGSASIEIENGSAATLSLSGQSAILASGSAMTVEAACTGEADAYSWYLDGELVQGAATSSIAVGEGLAAGYHSLMAVAEVGGIPVSAACYFTVQ